VRRRFIAERYAPMVDGLFSGASEASISAEITFEDGRKGRLEGRAIIHEPQTFGLAPARAKVAA